MILTVDLPNELERRLVSAAKLRGLTPEEFTLFILEEHLNQPALQKWHEVTVNDWHEFSQLLNEIEARRKREKHRFLYRGQADASWRLEPSLRRELASKNENRMRCFEIEQDAKVEFASQAHLHMDPAALPNENDWLEWWSLMQHYLAPTRLLDWSSSPYVAAYFAVEAGERDGVIWAVNDWAWGDRMCEKYERDWNQFWDKSIRPTSDWTKIASSFTEDRFFDEKAEPQIFFFQPKRRSQRIIAQQGWLSASFDAFVNYENVIAELFDKHRLAHQSTWEDSEYWKYWNCRIVIPKKQKREFLRRLQTMNITANSLFPGVDGLGKSVKEFIQIEVLHDKPGSSHSLP